jgi:RimJ/RimL family protein N-acetyltransferase
MIKSDRLLLRPWQESDLGFIQGLRNDIDLQALLLATARGSTVLAVRSWLEEKSSGSERLFFVAEISDTREPIGYIQLSIEPGSTNSWRFGICLASQYWSKGYGVESLEAIEHYLQVQHGTHKMMLQVDEANGRAVACYKSLGYREVGVMLRHVEVQGRLRNVMVMEKWIRPNLEHVD